MWCNIKSNQCSLNVPFCNLATVTVKTSSSQHASRTDGEQKHDSLLTFDTPHTWFMKYKEELSDFNVATWSCWDAFPGAQDSAEVMLRTRRQTLMQALFRRNEKRYSHWKPFGDGERERERRERGEREREREREEATKRAAYVSSWARAEQQTFKQREALRSCRSLRLFLCSSFYVPIIMY